VGSPLAYSLRALETARQCVILGARLRTIAHITGLTPGYILRAVYCKRYPAPIGRPQYSEDFFFKTTRRLQAEACFLATHYRRLTSEGFLQADALIAAFRHHRATQPESTLGFDQAFFLISRLDGIWAATKSGLSFVECLNCRSPYLAPHGMPQRDSCPVCRTDWRLKSQDPCPCAQVHPARAGS
jgi:flagellar transcriptional activator FlhC